MRWLPTRGGRWPSHLDRATREALGIPSRERVPVVATNQALYGGPLAPRVRWDEIGRATWEEPLLSLTGTVDGDPCSGSIELVEPGLLTAAIRTQVTDSVVIAERLDLGPGPGAQAIARRASQDGEIRWTIAFDPGADPADRDLRARADRALAELRATLGI